MRTIPWVVSQVADAPDAQFPDRFESIGVDRREPRREDALRAERPARLDDFSTELLQPTRTAATHPPVDPLSPDRSIVGGPHVLEAHLVTRRGRRLGEMGANVHGVPMTDQNQPPFRASYVSHVPVRGRRARATDR